MPVINVNIEDLERLSGEGFSLEDFKEEIPMIGATVEKVEDEEIAIEFFPNRPDLFSVEGITRAYRQFKGDHAEDLRDTYHVDGSSGIEMTVDPGLIDIRPVIGGAFIRGVTIEDKALISIMNLQEKLHITVGRKRRKVAIGIHDAGPLKPPFRYWAARPDEVEFVPLQKEGNWNLRRILEEHEKGTAYAWILDGMEKYPIITDSEDQVLSFPPIINGELTKVTEETKDIFVDCTGWDLKAVKLAVNIVCSQLVTRGGNIEDVKIIYPKGEGFDGFGLETGMWPRFEWKEEYLDIEWARKWLGGDLSVEDMISSLGRMGFEDAKEIDGKIKALVPPWRNDILHQADLAEDIAIGFGLNNFNGIPSGSTTIGSERRFTTLSRYARQTMTGLGFLEVRTISLSNEDAQFTGMGREEVDHLKLSNPITIDHTMMRLSAIPTLLSLLRSNKHRDLPQRIFEIADVMLENHSKNVITGLSESTKSSLTEVKGYVQRLLGDLRVAFIPEPAGLGWYIKGRGAAIMVELPEGSGDGYKGPFPELEGGKMIPLGHFGEIDPSIIEDYELGSPVSAFEMDMDLLIRLCQL